MDKETAISTGIYKLSKEERAKLSKWLNHSQEETVKQQKKANMGFRANSQSDKDRVDIHSSVAGEFNGWHGRTTFKLENGQVWKQMDKSIFYIPKRNNPDITIKPKILGSWSLSVDGYSRAVKVKRIK
jgi:hypothetical protein